MFLVCLSWDPLHASHACKAYIASWLTLSLCAHVWPSSPTPYAVGADHEASLVMQALRLNTLSKLTFVDSKWFISLVADIFVGVAFEDVAQPDLEQALHRGRCTLLSTQHRYTM